MSAPRDAAAPSGESRRNDDEVEVHPDLDLRARPIGKSRRSVHDIPDVTTVFPEIWASFERGAVAGSAAIALAIAVAAAAAAMNWTDDGWRGGEFVALAGLSAGAGWAFGVSPMVGPVLIGGSIGIVSATWIAPVDVTVALLLATLSSAAVSLILQGSSRRLRAVGAALLHLTTGTAALIWLG